MATILRQGVSKGGSIPGLLDGSGQVLQASFANVQRAFNDVYAKSGLSQTGDLGNLRNTLPPLMDVQKWMGPAGTTPFSAGDTVRILDAVTSSAGGLLQRNVLNPLNITRLTKGSPEHAAALQATEEVLQRLYPGVNNRVLSVEAIPAMENKLTNVDVVKFQVGKANGDLFKDIPEAMRQAKYMGLKGSQVKVGTRGGKYFLEFTTTADETVDSVRSALKTVAQNIEPTPGSWWKGWWTTADELLPRSISMKMKAASVGAQDLSAYSSVILDDALQQLPKGGLLSRKGSRQDFMRFIENQRSFYDPAKQQTGRWSRDLPEFTHDWAYMFGRVPTVEEAIAYSTYRQVNDVEYVQRIMNINKGKLRKGVMEHSFGLGGGKYTNPVEGRVLDAVPWSEAGDFGVLVMSPNNKKHHYINSKFSTKTASPTKLTPGRDDIDLLVRQGGYKVFQISEWGEEALRSTPGLSNIGSGPISYVVAKPVRSKNLPAMPIEYKGSGHMAYLHDYMVSQPKIRKYSEAGEELSSYYGDTTLFMQPTAQSAREVVEDLNRARIMLKNKDFFGLRNFLTTSRIPMGYTDFVRMFKGKNKRFDLDTPFYNRERGKRTYDLHATDMQGRDGFKNITDYQGSLHNLYHDDLNLQYAMQRDAPARSAINIGSVNNPVYSIEPAPLIDAVTTMQQSSSQMARARYLDDIKIQSAERFVQEFPDLIDMTPNDIKHYPMRALVAPLKKPSTGDYQRYRKAREFKRAINEFLTTASDDNLRAQAAVNGIAELVLGRLGDARGMRAMEYINPLIAATIKDPVHFFRNVGFHTKMGFWNVKQLFMQGQGVIATAALEGMDHAAKGFVNGSFMRTLALSGSDDLIDEAAKRNFAVTGMKPKHFREMYEAARDAGWLTVGRDYGTIDDFLSGKVITTKAGKVLESGLMFFREGEKLNRYTAYAAAYQSWRKANPLLKFDEAAQIKILDRADLLTSNMTRASNAGWNRGWASVPTQFWSYHARMMDQMLGTRLTRSEKARMIAVYSTLYGVPAGSAGLSAGTLIPWTEVTREALMSMGIEAQDNFITDMLLNGVPQATAGMLMGDEAPNIGAFGPTGNPALKDLIEGDWEVLLGASGKIAKNAGQYAFEAIASLLWNGFGGSEDPITKSYFGVNTSRIPLSWSAAQPIISEISSFNNVQKGIYAIAYGTWYMKADPEGILHQQINEETGMPESAWLAGLAQMAGVQPVAVEQAFNRNEFQKDVRAVKTRERGRALSLYKKLDNATSDDDRELYEGQLSLTLSLFSPQERLEILRDHMTGRKPFSQQQMERTQKMEENMQLRQMDREQALEGLE